MFFNLYFFLTIIFSYFYFSTHFQFLLLLLFFLISFFFFFFFTSLPSPVSVSLSSTSTSSHSSSPSSSFCSRIVALFRLSARMINRDLFTNSIIELFKLFLPTGNVKQEDINDIKNDIDYALNGTDDLTSTIDTHKKKLVLNSPGFDPTLLAELSGQVSSGIWRVLTTNLEVLPTLTLSQWQIVFDVIGT